jgi:hypothetical protein
MLSVQKQINRSADGSEKIAGCESGRTRNARSCDYFFSQVFPLSALLQISWLLVEITTSAGPGTSM